MENENRTQVENTDSSNDKLLLSDVSQQRELLLAFVKWYNNGSISWDNEISYNQIDKFLKANNCD